MGFQQPDCLFVEGHESVCTKPAPFIGDGAIGKVATCVEQRESGISGRSIHDNICAAQQNSDRAGNIGWPDLIAL